MDLVQAITDKKILAGKIKSYIIKNKKEIEKEYGFKILDNIEMLSEKEFSAWVQVYASKILLKKKVKNCLALKLYVKDYLNAHNKVEKIDNEITKDGEVKF